METNLLSVDHPDALRTAQNFLAAGELVAFPTDTVYGLAAAIDNPKAIEKLFIAKGRSDDKAIPVLIGQLTDLFRVAVNLNPVAHNLAKSFWPGALTLILPRHPDLPHILSPYPTVGVRMPDHPVALALLRLVGPLAVTSANWSGSASATSADEVLAQLNGRIAYVLDGGQTPGGTASTIVDCTRLEWVILREGPISKAMIATRITI